MSFRSVIQRKLEDAGGIYEPNRFLVSLDKSTPFVVESGTAQTLDSSHLHVFAHEYWHYWQNISTTSGFKSFMVSQSLLAIFSRALIRHADGTSDGMRSISLAEKGDIGGLIEVLLNMEGEGAPRTEWLGDWDLSFAVTGMNTTERTVRYQGGDAPLPTVTVAVEVNWPCGAREDDAFDLGAFAIEESVAYLVEEKVRDGMVATELEPPPEFPYRVVERVFEWIVGAPVESTYYPAALGTLALMAPHPGPAFYDYCRLFKMALKSSGDVDRALDEVISVCSGQIIAAIDQILDAELNELTRMQQGRGLLEGALSHLSGVYRRALELRKESLLFDLDVVFPTATEEKLTAHMKLFPSCDLLQERTGQPNQYLRDMLFSFDTTLANSSGHRPTDFLRCLQAQQDYLFAHIDFEKREIEESDAANSRCPFFTACDHPKRTTSGEHCRTAPWNGYSRGDKEGCWYTTAVAASLGTVNIS